MSRKKAHFEEGEPFLESVFSALRFRKIIGNIPKDSKILDMGCGYNANLLKRIYGKNCEYTGVDVSVNKGLNSSRVILIEHDLNGALPFLNDTFDTVVSLANLEHLQNPEAVSKEIYRVLKPGGTFLLTTPSIYAKPVLEFLSFKLHLVSEDEIMDHKNYFDKQSLSNICKKAGFLHVQHNYFQLFMNNFILAKK